MRPFDSRSVGMVTSSVNRGSSLGRSTVLPAGTGGAGFGCARTRSGADDSSRPARATARPIHRHVLDMGPLSLRARGAGDLLATVQILTQPGGGHKAIPPPVTTTRRGAANTRRCRVRPDRYDAHDRTRSPRP